MADASPKVMEMVQRALKKNPDLTSRELQKRALKIDKSVGKLSGRQFHARTLQIRKKLLGTARPQKRASRRKKTGNTTAQQATDPVLEVLSESFSKRRAALNEALDGAFDRAIKTDSVKKVNRLLSSIDRETREFERV